MMLDQQIKDMLQEKNRCKEELIQQLLLHLILLEENKELIVGRDRQHQINLKLRKCSLTEVLKHKDSQDKEALMLTTKCQLSVIRDRCSHKMLYLQSLFDQTQAKITIRCNQKERVQETQLVVNQ